MISCLALFWQFMKFGLLCFGGGYMLIPLLVAEFVGDGKLLTMERFANLVSIAQVTPGPIGANTATFVGFISNGFFGAFSATTGLVFPTLILAGAAASLIQKYKDHTVMKSILFGARLAAMAMVCYAVVVFLELSVFTSKIPWKAIGDFLIGRGQEGAFSKFGISVSGLIIFSISLVLSAKTKISTIWVIILSGVLGAVLYPILH